MKIKLALAGKTHCFALSLRRLVRVGKPAAPPTETTKTYRDGHKPREPIAKPAG